MHPVLTLLLIAACSATSFAQAPPRVFVFTDINIDAGDPDDRQSLVHILWYSDELRIEGIVPDRIQAGGVEAIHLALEAYRADYQTFELARKGFASPDSLRRRIAERREDVVGLFQRAVYASEDPLYVLIWGNMASFAEVLTVRPELVERIRVITIGTGLMLERNLPYLPESWERSPPCEQLNWNGQGRSAIYDDPRFDDLWWVEINWTYEGMFSGPEPGEMLDSLAAFGAMGHHLEAVVEHQAWAQYFRVGDTPSVLYVIDPSHDRDDPTQGSWAGRFVRPFPDTKPHYYTDSSGALDWNYADPCATWQIHEQVRDAAAATLEAQRPDMYAALLTKLRRLYR